jgi:hypothetical protein
MLNECGASSKAINPGPYSDAASLACLREDGRADEGNGEGFIYSDPAPDMGFLAFRGWPAVRQPVGLWP